MSRPLSAWKFESAALRHQWLNFVNEYPALPPILSTESASTNVFKKTIASFTDKKGLPDKRVAKFAPSPYRISRFDGKVRFLELPHPVPYFFLVQSLSKNWDAVNPLINSESSRIRPQHFPRTERIVIFGHSYENEELPVFSLSNGSPELEFSLSRGTVVQLDISNFFPSVYTHALDWAVSGKRTTSSGPGSEIDKAFQCVRTRRTDGISIGPVTSHIAAEIMLYGLDKRIAGLGFPTFYTRAIDDLTILIPPNQDPDELSNLVSNELSRVGLALNHAKTKVTPLKSFHSQHISKSLSQITDLISQYPSKKKLRQAFSSLYVLADKNPGSSLVKYGWKQIRSIIDSEIKRNSRYNPSYFVTLSWEMAAHYPHMIPSVVAESLFHEQKLDGRVPEQFICDLLSQHLQRGVTDTITWLLFYCQQQSIDPTVALKSIDFFNLNKLSELRSTSIDAFVGCTLLSFDDPSINQQLVQIFSDPGYFTDNRTLKWSDQWPIRYSLYLRGLLTSADLKPQESQAFSVLKSEGFSILRDSSIDYRSLISDFRGS